MGKKKLDLTTPKTKAEEDINLQRRLPGLLKKANEIGNLTCSKVLLLVLDSSGNSPIVYSNDYLDIFFANYQELILEETNSAINQMPNSIESIKITNNCQFIDPEQSILSFSFDYNESMNMNDVSFYKETFPPDRLLSNYDFKSYYVPTAKKITYAQYKRNKEAEKERRFNQENKYEFSIGKPIETSEHDSVLDYRKDVVNYWLKNQTNDYLPNSDLNTLDSLFQMNDSFKNLNDFNGIDSVRGLKDGIFSDNEDENNKKKYKIFESLLE